MDIIKGLISYGVQLVTGDKRPLSVNASDELMVSIGSSGAVQDINVAEINGNTTATTAISGTMPNEGTSADGNPHDGSYPINVGGLASAADPVYLAGDKVEFSFDLAGRARTNSDLKEINGNAVATTGVNGTMPAEGTQATGTALDASYPIKIGGEIVQVPDTKTNGHLWNTILDLERFLRVVSKSFDSLAYADRTSNLNTSATDYGYFLIAQETNITQPAVQYYPSASGWTMGSRKNLGILLRLEDITSVALEVTNDPTLTNWEEITANVTDPNTGLLNYASSHWTEPGSGTPITMAMALDKIEFTHARLAVVGSAAANTFEAYGHSGAL